MNPVEQKKQAKEFATRWLNREGYEKGETSPFWQELLTDVFGESDVTKKIKFEDRVQLEHRSFIDVRIPHTKVLIEQKSAGIDLNAEAKQSDGSYLTPYEQAKRYSDELPLSEKPRWIVTCNFREFHIHDMENPQKEPTVITLKNFEKEFHYLTFLVDPKNENIHKEQELSVQAGVIVGKLYDAFAKAFGDVETNPESAKALNILCVRIVFCLYAEDAGLFPKHLQFYDYLNQFDTRGMRDALLKLFKVLDQPGDKRSKHESPELLGFPYVNGGLFSSESEIDIPQFTDEIRELLLQEASSDFDWSEISPTIFGAVFESTLNPVTRRQGGMHYTSVENIHKVIDPLFLDDLKKEFEDARKLKEPSARKKRLLALQDKMSTLTFLDPACGSGNFLTETYTSLRKIENDIVRILLGGQSSFEFADPVKISISQFYGIEINDFAVSVARTALWIAESQMLMKTQDIVQRELDFLPLKTNANIREANALEIDWDTVVPANTLNYLMGNPPFVGYQIQTKKQKEDIRKIYVDQNGKEFNTAGKNDYVGGWFYKASQMMSKALGKDNDIRAAFVATNSITQGEQAASIWKPLYELFNIHIDFAYRTFKWESDSSDMAAVHVVIVGLSCIPDGRQKTIFSDGEIKKVDVINTYLVDAPMVFIEARRKPIWPVSEMTYGSKPADGGYLLLNENEKLEFEKKYPEVGPYIKRFMNSLEFINNTKRYCLWLVDCPLQLLRACNGIVEKISHVREFRLSSPKAATRKSADKAWLFQEIRQSSSSYVLVPSVSSENRYYVPMGYEGKETICGNGAFQIPNASLYEFGILTSSVHMAWMRTVAGRLEMRYRYSNTIVYNNFVWPEPTDDQRKKIEATAQAILTVRKNHPQDSLADLYDPLLMPKDLREAHAENDRAVMKAYGFSLKMKEADVVTELFRRYQQRVKEIEQEEEEARKKAAELKAAEKERRKKEKAESKKKKQEG